MVEFRQLGCNINTEPYVRYPKDLSLKVLELQTIKLL